MRKGLAKWLVPAMTVLVLVFLGGYLLGRISTPYAISAETARTLPEPVVVEPAKPETSAGTGDRLDLNRATKEELMALPGIGEVLAERILEYRAVSGGFVTVEQLLEVEGIGEGKFAELKDFLTVEGMQ